MRRVTLYRPPAPTPKYDYAGVGTLPHVPQRGGIGLVLADLHDSIQRLLYDKGRILSQDVDVRFETPTREWIGTLVRPTVDFFLYEIRENTELRGANPHSNRANGRSTYKLPARRFDCFYLVSAITTQVDDEHKLLWRTLLTLLKYAELPEDVLTPVLREADPPLVAKINGPEGAQSMLDVWNRLETPPRPALRYVITVPVDVDITFEAPLVLTRTARYARVDSAPYVTNTHIGGVVRDRAGAPVGRARVMVAGSARAPVDTDAEGRFVLPNVDAGRLELQVHGEGRKPKKVTLEIPSTSYDIEID
jgi:uncharacterized protein DUF4255/carboxypeptidase family protein